MLADCCVHILAEPAAQGDVPAAPELGGRAGQVGVVEVVQKFEAQHTAQTDGHVGVAREVEVQLEGEGQNAQPCAQGGQFSHGGGQIDIPELTDGVGQKHLLCAAHHKALGARGKLVGGVVTVFQLLVQILVLQDGAGDQLGEQGDEGAEGDDVALGAGVTAVDVDGVAHGLEGVEGDADGQLQTQHRHEVQTDGGQIGGNEVPVLEEEQQGQIEDDRTGNGGFCPLEVALVLAPGDQHAVGVVNGDGGEHDDNVHRLAPAVEGQTDDEQHQVAEFQRYNVVQQQHNGQVEEQEIWS